MCTLHMFTCGTGPHKACEQVPEVRFPHASQLLTGKANPSKLDHLYHEAIYVLGYQAFFWL